MQSLNPYAKVFEVQDKIKYVYKGLKQKQAIVNNAECKTSKYDQQSQTGFCITPTITSSNVL